MGSLYSMKPKPFISLISTISPGCEEKCCSTSAFVAVGIELVSARYPPGNQIQGGHRRQDPGRRIAYHSWPGCPGRGALGRHPKPSRLGVYHPGPRRAKGPVDYPVEMLPLMGRDQSAGGMSTAGAAGSRQGRQKRRSLAEEGRRRRR